MVVLPAQDPPSEGGGGGGGGAGSAESQAATSGKVSRSKKSESLRMGGDCFVGKGWQQHRGGNGLPYSHLRGNYPYLITSASDCAREENLTYERTRHKKPKPDFIKLVQGIVFPGNAQPPTTRVARPFPYSNSPCHFSASFSPRYP